MAFRVPERPVSSTPNVTGDIEISAFDHVATIVNVPGGAIPVASLPNIDPGTFLANITGSTTTPGDHSLSTFAGAGLTYTNITGVLSWDGLNFRKNSAGSVFTRRRINLIEGSNVTITVDDDSGDDEVDVTIAATGGSSSANRRTDFEIVDDFFGVENGGGTLVSGGGTTLHTGSGSWGIVTTVNTGSYNHITGEAGRPGILRISTSASDNSSFRLFKNDLDWVTSPTNSISYNDIYRVEVDFRYNTNSGGGYFISLADSITRANCVEVNYDSDVDGSLRFRTVSSSTATETVLTLPSQAAWHTVAFELEPTEARCYIDGALAATHTTNLPTAAFLTPYILCFTRTTAARSMDLDFFWLRSNTLSR